LATQPPHVAHDTRPLASLVSEVMVAPPEIVTCALGQMLRALSGAACHFRQEWQWQIAEAAGSPVTSTSTAPQ